MTREEEIYQASSDCGYNKDGSYGLAFQEWAKWSDKHPSIDMIQNVLIACNAIKFDEKSHCAPLEDCPYQYMIDELINKIQNKLNEDGK